MLVSAGVAAQLAQMGEMAGKAAFQSLAVVGDDTAISANQLIGGQPDRKLPMVWRVVKGSLRNKAVIIPTAMLLSVTFPAAILPAMAVGGALLCFDSVEKLVHKKLDAPKGPVSEAYAKDHAAWENRHVKSALKTDLVLSAETTMVSLFAVAGAPFLLQCAAVVTSGLVMTGGVYGAVAGIIKLDDFAASLSAMKGEGFAGRTARFAGKMLGHAAPRIIKVIGAVGTAAMFAVGGTMLVHGIPGGEQLVSNAVGVLGANPVVHAVAATVVQGLAGVVAGFAALPVAKLVGPPLRRAYEGMKKIIRKPASPNVQRHMPAPAQPALQNMPDVKAALNAAASPAVAAPPPAPKPQAPAPKP